MNVFALTDLQSALRELKEANLGATPDRRIDAITKSIEAIEKWIDAFQRQLDEAESRGSGF